MPKRRRRRRPGKKHKIIFVTHSLSRLYRSLLFASVVVWSVWWVAPYSGSIFMPPNDQYLKLIGFGLMGLMLAAFMLRNRGYIQARDGYVRLQGIFFRIRIPYSRVENVQMAVFREVYRGVKLSWASRRFFKKHYKETVATLILK